MSVLFNNEGSGRFATARRGGLDQHERQFIRARAFEGRTARQIAKMIGRAVEDVLPWMIYPEEEVKPAPELKPDPVLDVQHERVPQPGDIVLSLWRGLLVVPSRNQTRREIAQEVAARFGVSVESLRGPNRSKTYTIPRQEAMWRMVQAHRWSTPQIGDFFGGRDHTTVLHACKAHAKRMAQSAMNQQEAA